MWSEDSTALPTRLLPAVKTYRYEEKFTKKSANASKYGEGDWCQLGVFAMCLAPAGPALGLAGWI